MRYRQLGRSGPEVSEIGLGTYLTIGDRSDESTAVACVRRAYEAGINFFDTADSYAGGEAERVLGRALAPYPRDSYVISTKCGLQRGNHPDARGLSRRNIFESVDASLRNLDAGHLDILFCHRFDPDCPFEETIRAMDDLTSGGKIVHWAVSRWSAGQMRDAVETSRAMGAAPPICTQHFYHPLNREAEQLFDVCQVLGMGLVAYSPLAQGVLTGKYKAGIPAGSRAADPSLRKKVWHLRPSDLERVAKLESVAKRHRLTLVELVLAWCRRHDDVTSILMGASRPEQIDQNLRSLAVDFDEALTSDVEVALGAG